MGRGGARMYVSACEDVGSIMAVVVDRRRCMRKLMPAPRSRRSRALQAWKNLSQLSWSNELTSGCKTCADVCAGASKPNSAFAAS